VGGVQTGPRHGAVRLAESPDLLVIVAGVRFSDLFTDISYILAVPSLTTFGWICLLPPPFLNLVGVLIMLRGYRESQADKGSRISGVQLLSGLTDLPAHGAAEGFVLDLAPIWEPGW
jgi:hypothetical protein